MSIGEDESGMMLNLDPIKCDSSQGMGRREGERLERCHKTKEELVGKAGKDGVEMHEMGVHSEIPSVLQGFPWSVFKMG